MWDSRHVNMKTESQHDGSKRQAKVLKCRTLCFLYRTFWYNYVMLTRSKEHILQPGRLLA
jgi:hypothetical protein